jgi:hypothetical protein
LSVIREDTHTPSAAYRRERDIPLLAKIGNPVPGKNALYTNDEVRQVWFDDLPKHIGVHWRIFVEYDFPVRINDADVHRFGVKINAAII